MVQQTNPLSASGMQDRAVHCITIPVKNETLLLPNAAVAEIIAYIPPGKFEDAPDWVLGKLSWRDYNVPLISFEAAMGKAVVPATKNSRIAVLNTLNGNSELPYIGILTQGIPGLGLAREQIITDAEEKLSDLTAVKMTVKFYGARMLIPDIDQLEERLLRLHLV